jgi:hypothetical protein
MAAKKATKKKAKKTTARKKSAVARLEAELPKTLRAYGKEVRTRLNRLERDVARARADASKRGTKLLREASEYLGKLEARGEREWRKGRTEAVKVLKKLERSVQPKPKRKKVARKKA